MRLPFPERVPLLPTLIFCAVLALAQQIEGTTLVFTMCTVGFVVMIVLAFNTSGGFTRPSGAYIASYALLAMIAGVTFKAMLGEAGQKNLSQPDLTIEVYFGTACALLLSAYLARRLRLKRSYLPNFTSDAALDRAALGSLLFGAPTTILLFFRTEGAASGSILSAFLQLNGFLTLAVVLGTISAIRKSGGRSSTNFIVWIAGSILFTDGILNYSKQGLFTPVVCWLFAAASQRFKVGIVQGAIILLTFGAVGHWLVPYSQYGRTFKLEGAPLSENLKINIALLSHLDMVRQADSQRSTEEYTDEFISRFYDQPQGIMDRMQMMTPDDMLVNYNVYVSEFGLGPTIYAFQNLVPHVIWRDKPVFNFGHEYAHQLGILSEEDEGTGISFSPSGDAFHQVGWVGIVVLLPLLFTFHFFMVDSLFGDTRLNVFAMASMLGYLHSAPEGGVAEIVRGATVGVAALFFITFILTRVMPFVANLLLGSPDQRRALPMPAMMDGGEPERL